MQLRTILFLNLITLITVLAGKHDDKEDNKNVNYKFGYGVHDPHSQDVKSHHEERKGDHVTGFYTVKEADGTTRVVHYKAGPHTGFEATVEKIGHAHHPAHNGHGGHKSDEGHGHGDHKSDESHGHGNGGGISWIGKTHHDNQGHEHHAHYQQETQKLQDKQEDVITPHNGYETITKGLGHGNHPAHYEFEIRKLDTDKNNDADTIWKEIAPSENQIRTSQSEEENKKFENVQDDSGINKSTEDISYIQDQNEEEKQELENYDEKDSDNEIEDDAGEYAEVKECIVQEEVVEKINENN